jgi:hypothetical protein
MTLSGLVSHVRWVEYFWFQVMLLGEEDHGPWTEEDPDREMRIAVEVPIPPDRGDRPAQRTHRHSARAGRRRDRHLTGRRDVLTLDRRRIGSWWHGHSRSRVPPTLAELRARYAQGDHLMAYPGTAEARTVQQREES